MELFIIRDGQQTGPFSQETVQDLLKRGGLRPEDMGWHKGLPAWLPLAEVFEPAAQRRTEPPPVNGANSGIRPRPATSRQKALLQYLGAAIPGKATREDAALAISDALENPKMTNRIAKWGDEKLRLHPDLFQEEVDFRRANRITRYLELCQTDGAEVVKDVTKAHVQVLMESLDKRQVGWDQDSRSALWDFLLPSVSEHFPQLVQEEWKGKLRYGGTLKVAAAYAGIPATGMLVPPAESPSAFQAAIRGVVYGLVALGAVIAGIYFFKGNGKTDVTRNDGKSAEAPAVSAPVAGKPVESPAPAAAPGAVVAENEPAHPTNAPLIGATPENVGVAAPPPAPAPAAETVPAPTPAPADKPMAATPAPEPAVAPAAPAASAPLPTMNTASFTPAPPPPGAEATPRPTTPETPAAPAAAGPAVRSAATLTQPVTVQLQFGKVTLPPGTKVRLIALEGANARVNFNNNILHVPVSATDIDPANTVVAAAPVAPASVPLVPTVTAPPAPAAPAPAPKSSPLSDL